MAKLTKVQKLERKVRAAGDKVDELVTRQEKILDKACFQDIPGYGDEVYSDDLANIRRCVAAAPGLAKLNKQIDAAKSKLLALEEELYEAQRSTDDGAAEEEE